MRVSELRAYFNDHPKASREASRPRKDWLREMFATPPETRELLRALKAYREGKEAPFWSWVERRIGRTPDELLHAVLRGWLRHGAELPIPLVFDVLRYHGQRLERGDPVRWYEDQSKQVYGQLNKNPRWELIEYLIEDWYVNEHEREKHLKGIVALKDAKEQERGRE